MNRVWLDDRLEAAHDPRPGTPKAPVTFDPLEVAEMRCVIGHELRIALDAGNIDRVGWLLVLREEWAW